MKKFIAIVVLLGAILLTMGTCSAMCDGGCDSSNSGSGCGTGCDTGCSSSGCDLSQNNKTYYGNITFNIHTHDGQVITVSGHRNEGVDGYIVDVLESYNNSSTLTGYDIPYRRGYCFFGLYYEKRGNKEHLIHRQGRQKYQVDTTYLLNFEDNSTIDLYEEWESNGYYVIYKVDNSTLCTKTYYYGSTVEIPNEVASYLENRDRPKEILAGWKVTSVRWDSTFEPVPWTFGTFDDEKDEIFKGAYYDEIVVEAVFESIKVNVKLHYDFESKPDEEKQVSYDQNLSVYFEQRESTQTEVGVEFFGWYLDEERTQKFTGEIDLIYQTQTLNLYADWKYYKTIKINYKNGEAPKTVKVYDDNTLSRNMPADAYGISEQSEGTLKINEGFYYTSMQEGKTYYVVYLSDLS